MTLELKESKVLQFNPNTLRDVRKNHGLDYPGMCQAIDILKEWINKQEHLVKKDFNTEYLERVIITCKGSLEVAKTRVDKMCTLRTVLPDFFDKFHAINGFPNLGDKIICVNAPKQTEDNCRIYIMQFRSNDITAAVLKDTYKFSIIMSEYVKLKDYSDGVYGILDIRNINIMNVIPHFNPVDARNVVSVYMDGYGFRMKAIYILSASKTVNVFVNFIRPLFSAKVGQRIQVFSDMESLYKCLPKHLLPEDYGGEQKSIKKLFGTLLCKHCCLAVGLSMYQVTWWQQLGRTLHRAYQPRGVNNIACCLVILASSVLNLILALSISDLLALFSVVSTCNEETNDKLSINSKLLLNSDETSLRAMLNEQNIDPDCLSEMLRNIQDWYHRQPHLPEVQLHDQFVIRLLIMRKFSLQKVKEKIDNYYSIRNNMAELLSNRDPLTPQINQYLKTGYWIVLPRKTPENHRVTIFRMKNCDGKSVIELIKVILMIADYRLWNDTVMGEQCILDFENITVQLAMQLTPVLISKIVFYVTSCIGAKLKGLHFVHLPKHAAFIFSLFKKLLKPKLVERIYEYNSFGEVMRKFPENIFPNDLGGTDDVTCQEITDAWARSLSSPDWRHYFLDQDSVRSDESKRTLAKPSNFGIEGSFKKLNID